MTILATGAGLIGTAFARYVIQRDEDIVVFDPEPRESFLRFKPGDSAYRFSREDARDLPVLVDANQNHKATTVVHTTRLLGGRVLGPQVSEPPDAEKRQGERQ